MNERYVHLVMCLMDGLHIKHCMTGEEYYIICNCVADEYLVWLMSEYANGMLNNKINKNPNMVSQIDVEKRNMFQDRCFLKDEDFLFMNDDDLFYRDKETCVAIWSMMGTFNICPCDWFMKFK
jgi:hypothetical protein